MVGTWYWPSASHCRLEDTFCCLLKLEHKSVLLNKIIGKDIPDREPLIWQIRKSKDMWQSYSSISLYIQQSLLGCADRVWGKSA